MSITVEPQSSVLRTAPSFFANSVLAAAIGVALARLAEQSSIAVVAAFLDRNPVITNSGTVLRNPGSDLVLVAGPITSLVLGLTLLLLYPGAKDRSAGRLVMLWTMLFAFRNACVALALGAVDEGSPVGLVFAHWNVPDGIDIALAIVGALALVLIAIGAAPAFLSFSRHRSEVATGKERLRFAASIALIPGLAGPLLAVAMFLPDAGAGFVTSLPLAGSFIIITVLAAAGTKSFKPPEVIEERGMSVGLIATFVAMVLVVRFGLGPGVPIPPWNDSLDLTWRP
jgi:hypothetical protein